MVTLGSSFILGSFTIWEAFAAYVNVFNVSSIYVSFGAMQAI
jgi:hypothetical protein